MNAFRVVCRLKFAVDNSSVDDAQIELHKRRARHLSTTRVAVRKIEALAVLLMSGLFPLSFFFAVVPRRRARLLRIMQVRAR